jgi:hypothetical protein
MADMRERARKFLAELPQCKGYPTCDGDLVATEHEPGCPMFGNPERTSLDVLTAFAESLALPQAEPVCPKCPICSSDVLFCDVSADGFLIECQASKGAHKWELTDLEDFARFFRVPAAAPPGDAEIPARQDFIEAVTALLDAMETCHICKGALIVQEEPPHCENCSGDCDDHDEPNCPTIQSRHADLRRRLKRLAASVLNTGAETPDSKGTK